MFKKNLIVKTLAASALLAASGAALATEVTVQASTTVNNAIDLTVTGALNFGTIRATIGNPADGDCAGLRLPANPNQPIVPATDTETGCTASTASIATIDRLVERPEFTVVGLAPFTTVTLNAINRGNDANLAIPGSPSSFASFVLTDWTAYLTSGSNPGDITLGGTDNLDANNVGEITFTVGATLVTPDAAVTDGITSDYQDAEYSGDFTVEVVY